MPKKEERQDNLQAKVIEELKNKIDGLERKIDELITENTHLRVKIAKMEERLIVNAKKRKRTSTKMNKIKDTKIGKFLAEKAPNVLKVVGSALPDSGTLGIIKNLIDGEPDLSPEEKAQMHAQLVELYNLEVKDRDSARNREVEMMKAGAQDWMMNVTVCSRFICICLFNYCNSIYYST